MEITKTQKPPKGGLHGHTLEWKRRAGRIVKSVLRILFLICMSFVMLYPILFMLSSAFKSILDAYDPTVIWVPKHFSLEPWKMAIEAMEFWKSFGRTLQMLIPCVLLEVVSTTLTAYGFARFKFRERNFLFGLLIFTIIVPVQTYMIPQYVGFSHFNFFGVMAIPGMLGAELPNIAANTFTPMYLMAGLGMGIRSGLYIFIMRQFLRGLPVELEEAALIDGANLWKLFWKIVFPLLKPVTTTIVIFDVMWIWNDFMLPYLFISSSDKFTLIMEVYKGVGQFANNWTVMLCTMVIVLIPITIFYVAMQKHIIAGITSGAVKG